MSQEAISAFIQSPELGASESADAIEGFIGKLSEADDIVEDDGDLTLLMPAK